MHEDTDLICCPCDCYKGPDDPHDLASSEVRQKRPIVQRNLFALYKNMASSIEAPASGGGKRTCRPRGRQTTRHAPAGAPPSVPPSPPGSPTHSPSPPPPDRRRNAQLRERRGASLIVHAVTGRQIHARTIQALRAFATRVFTRRLPRLKWKPGCTRHIRPWAGPDAQYPKHLIYGKAPQIIQDMDGWDREDFEVFKIGPAYRTYVIRYEGRSVSPWAAINWKSIGSGDSEHCSIRPVTMTEHIVPADRDVLVLRPDPVRPYPPLFQIQFRAPDGSHHTLDNVRSFHTHACVLRCIVEKLGGDHVQAASHFRLVKEGKTLEPNESGLLQAGDTVHVLARLRGGAPALRSRRTAPACGASLPEAPIVSFFQGKAHGGQRIVELGWLATMHPDKGAFADPWVSPAERAAMPAHLGIYVTYFDEHEVWHPTTVVTESATQSAEWGMYPARRAAGGTLLGAMLDMRKPSEPSRYLVGTPRGIRDAASAREGGPKRANDPRGTRPRLFHNAWLWSHGWLAVAPWSSIEPLRPDLSHGKRRKREVLYEYDEHSYWFRQQRNAAALPRPVGAPDGMEPMPAGADHGREYSSDEDGDGPCAMMESPPPLAGPPRAPRAPPARRGTCGSAPSRPVHSRAATPSDRGGHHPSSASSTALMLATAASMTPSPERLPPHARMLGAGGLPPSPRETIERKERFSERKARDACDSIMMYSEIDRAVGSSSERRAGSPQPTTARAARAAAATDVASQLVKDDSAYALHQGHESELRNMVVDAAAARDAGIPNGTASADEWGFAWCRRFATATSNRWMRPREAASALDQLRENYFFMMALVWITQMIAPSARRRAQGYERGKPTSALLAIYAYARVLRDCGRHVPNLHDARSVLQGLCMRYKNVWGDEALVPEHKKPYSRAHIVRMVQLLASVAVAGWSGTLHAAMLAAVCYSIATGVRKDEWTLSFLGDTYVRRSNFHWVDEITGNDLPDVPATWQSRRNGHLLRGRCAASKCDRLNIEWGGKDMWFRYDDSNPFNFAWRWCEWELAHPCPQGARQRWPAFSPSGDGTPFKAAQADALLRTLLMLAMSSADAMCRTWHSFRVTIATIIVNSQDIARDEVEGIAHGTRSESKH